MSGDGGQEGRFALPLREVGGQLVRQISLGLTGQLPRGGGRGDWCASKLRKRVLCLAAKSEMSHSGAVFSDLGFYPCGRRARPAVESGDCFLPSLGGCGSRCHDNKRKAGGPAPCALWLKPPGVWTAKLPGLVKGGL